MQISRSATNAAGEHIPFQAGPIHIVGPLDGVDNDFVRLAQHGDAITAPFARCARADTRTAIASYRCKRMMMKGTSPKKTACCLVHTAAAVSKANG